MVPLILENPPYWWPGHLFKRVSQHVSGSLGGELDEGPRVARGKQVSLLGDMKGITGI